MESVGEAAEVIFTFIVIFIPLTTLIFALRFWASLLIKRPLSADDGFAILTYVSSTSQASFFLWGIFDGGLGKPSTELNAQEKVIILKLIYISSIVWILGQVFAKLTILFFYNRIFTVEWFQKVLYGLIAFTAAYVLTFLFVFVFHCQPISNLWDPQPGGWCRQIPLEEYTSTSFSIAIDVIIIVLPIPVLWGLRMTMYKRIALISMFSIGLITVGIMLWRLAQTAQSKIGPDTDLSQEFPTIGLIALIELWLGLIVSCIPTLAPLLNRYVVPWFTKVRNRLSSWFGSPKPTPQKNPPTLETIGAKRSREKYWQLHGSIDPLSTGFSATNTTECGVDGAPTDHLEFGAVHVRKDVQLTST